MQSQQQKKIHVILNNKKPKYDLFKKNIFTKNKFVKVASFDTVPEADAEAEFIRNQKFIQSNDKPTIKTKTKIVRVVA